MARRPRRTPPPTLVQKLIALVKRHPLKTLAACVVFLGGVPTAAGGYSMLMAWADPALPALHYYVMDRLAPILKVQNTQANSIDRFLLYSQQRDLAVAQSDPAAKTSAIVQGRIRELQEQIQETSDRIKKNGGR